jgi:hypothetical protein
MAWTPTADIITGDFVTAAQWNDNLGVDGNTQHLYDNKADKEKWYPVAGGTGSALGLGHLLAGAGEYAGIICPIPADFNAITSIVVVVLPIATQAAANWDIATNYGAVGQAYNTHTGSDNTTTYNVTDNQWYAVNIASCVASLAAGDVLYVKFTLSNADHDVYVNGVLLKYT